MVPPASGDECARALRRAGFDVDPDGPDCVAVKKDGVTLVHVPLLKRLRPDLLVAILKAVGVSPSTFTQCLDG